MFKFKKKEKFLTALGMTLSIIAIKSHCLAFSAINGGSSGSIGTAEVTAATENIKRVITSIAMPLGGVLIFASIVVAALKMIANANNPQKRSESIGSLAWICGGRCNLRCKSNNCRNYYKCRYE